MGKKVEGKRKTGVKLEMFPEKAFQRILALWAKSGRWQNDTFAS
jgi:hypothetical protein